MLITKKQQHILKMKIFFIILIFIYSSSKIMAGELKLVRPDPSLSPKDVVRIVVKALKNNDLPRKNNGVKITFSFASPANKRNTGPFKRFNTMIRGQTYLPMINHRGATYENYNVTDAQASIDVILISSTGKTFGYRFRLTRQNGNKYEGSWMTDAVTPIQVTAL